VSHYLSDMPQPKKVWEAAGGAIVTGIICGYLSTTTGWAYYVALAVTIIGGLPAGSQHRTLRGAALRGVAAGGLWSLALLATIQISDREAGDAIPRPMWVIVVIAVVFTALVSSVVWTIVNRRRQRTATKSAAA